MRIEQSQPSPLKPAEGAQPAEKPTEPESCLLASGNADQVALSRLSQVLRGSLEESARTEQLRAAVAAGAYQVPGVEVSRRLVDFHLAE